MICPLCGFENNKQAKFCNECGALLRAVKDIEIPSSTGETASLDYLNMPYGADAYDPPHDHDTSGFDEYLIDSGYVAPALSWKTGDTMEMPSIADKTPERKEFRAPDRSEKSAPRRLIVFIAVFLLGLAILSVAAVTYQMEIWGGKSLPDVNNKYKDEATAILEERGFTVRALQVKSDDEEGLVLLMDPGAGRRLSEGSEVVLQVATPRVIPEVAGKPLTDAQAALEQEGFERVEYLKVKSDEVENTVLSIEPVAGEKAKASTPVKVTIAEPYIVPEVVGSDNASAVSSVEAAGFVANVVYVYSDQSEGTVLQTDPGAGTKLASGSTVTIQVAKSRATELVEVTKTYLANLDNISIGGGTYAINSVGDVSYVEGNTTVAVVFIDVPLVNPVTGQPSGTVETTERTVTFLWNDDNSISSYA